mgnify:CR=1 FL=1
MLSRITKGACLSGVALCLISFFALAQSKDNQSTPLDLPVEGGVDFFCSGGEKAAMGFLGPETIALDFMGEEHVLPRERAASGAKYSSDGITFWNKGDMAMIEIDGVKYSCERCR